MTTEPDPDVEMVAYHALVAAREYLRSVESNVVQDRITEKAVAIALDYVRPYIVVPPNDPPRVRFRTALWRWFVEPLVDLYDEISDRWR
jgi:hypothetical protein